MKKRYFIQLFILLSFASFNQSFGQVLWSSTGGSAWLTGTNWTGSAVPTSSQIAQFGLNPTAATGVGINFNSATNAGTQINGQRIEDVGAIEITSARTAAHILGNSSGTAGATGIFRFLGTNVNSIPNTIIRNNSNQNFTIQNTQGTGNQTMSVILGNTANNIINVDGTGNIVISSAISGGASGNKLSFNANSSGDLRLSGNNTYDGGTIINGGTSGGRLRIDAVNSLPTTGGIDINTGGRMTLNIAGTFGGLTQILTFNPTQVTNPSLDILSGAAVAWQGPVVLNADTRIEANGSAGTLTFSGNISGTGTLNKQGGGILILSGTGNSLTGGTVIGNGTLTVNNSSSMGTGGINMSQTSTNNTAINLNNSAQTISSLASNFTATTGTQTQIITLGSGHTLTINQSTNTTYGSGAVSTLTSTLAGSGNLTKSGTGTLTLTSGNTYTGTSKISNGKLDLGIANALSSSTNIIIDGGILGTSTGFTQTVGTLNVNVTGSIALGASSHTLTFAASGSETWNGTTLTITGWTGTAGFSGTNGKIFVGSNSSGLTSAQLAKISFSGFSGTAIILSTGEIVPAGPTISGTAIATPFTTTYGTASDSQIFSVSGSNLTANLIATAPTGFEVSSDGITYGSTATFIQSSGTASGSLRIRLTAGAVVTGSYNSQNIVLSSAGATAVNITTASSGNIVSAKALTITTPTVPNKVYDRTNAATISGTLSGIVGSDVVSLNGTGIFSQIGVGSNLAVTSTATLSGPDAANYSLTQPIGLTGEIVVKPLTVSGASVSAKTYDGTNTATLVGATLGGIISPDVVTLTGGAIFSSVNVANGISINTSSLILSGSDAANYIALPIPGLTGNITAKLLTVSGLSVGNKVYDGNTTATLTETPTLNGIIGTDDVSISGTPLANFNTKNVGTTKPITVIGYTLSGTKSDNYTVSQPTGLTADITQKPLSVTGTTAANKIYDGTSAATLSGATLAGVISPDDVSVSGNGTFAAASVADGILVTPSLTLSGSDASNYSLTQPTGLTANITAKNLTITGLTANNKIYDGNTTATLSGTATLNGIIAGDEANVTLSGTPTATFTQSTAGTGIGVTVTGYSIGGSSAGNYTLAQPTGLTADITALGTPVINSGLTASATYGTPSLTYTITATNSPTSFSATGLPNGLIINTTTGEITGTPTSVTGSPFSVTISATNASGTGNATLVYTINKKELTVNSPLGVNKVYDRNNFATITGTLTGIVGTDIVSLNGAGTFVQANVGTNISIASTSTLAGADASNYELTQPTGLKANITSKALTVIGSVTSNKEYDGNTTATITGSTLVGVINPDVVSVSGNGDFASVDVGDGIALTTSFTLGGVDASNYSLTQPSGLTANITKKPLTLPDLTIANKTYDGTNSATLSGSLTLSGIINSDEVTVASGSLSVVFDNKNVGTAKPVTVTGNSLTGAKANNYSLSIPTGLTANITAKELTVTGAVASNKVYDGSATSAITGSTLVGVINPDVVTITQSGTFAQSNVGDGIAVSSTSILAGTDAGNYSLTQPTGLTANITTKPLTITGVTANNKNYDGTITATLAGVATAALTGLVTGDELNVSLGGTPVANFAQSAVGNAIAVTVTGFTISGTASGNYSLTQPTGLTANIVAVPAPVINSVLTSSATYGTVAATYVITATNSPTSFNATGLPAGLNINTITGEITGTPTSITGSPFSVTISATNNGGTGTATLVYTINQKILTITAPLANNKVYDKTNVATISGTLNGVFGSDDVILNGTGTFSQVNVGTSLAVNSTSTLSGADATKYTLTQPTGLTANITAKPLTITNPVAQNKVFDGNTNATITGTLTGVISPDVVTLAGTGTFASSAVGNGIAVSSTSTLGGTGASNYSLTQPTGLTANITASPNLTEVILPQYMQGLNGTNSNRIPFAFRATLNNLNPNAIYRFYNSVILGTEATTSNGAGNIIFPSNTGSWVRSSGPSLSTVGNYGEFTTDASGSYTGWFITEPSGNATRFIPGNDVFMRIMLNNGAGGTTVTTRLTTTNSVKIINTVAASGANNGTGFRGNSGATPKNFVFVYDNENGTDRPLSGSFVESDGTANTTLNSYSSFYSTNVDGVAGAYGVIIPNTNTNGVRRIEQRDFSTGAVVGCPATDADGIWTSGANTVNPTGGTTAIAITLNDAPLNTCVVVNTPPTIGINVSSTSDYVDGGLVSSPVSSFASSSVLSDPTNPIQNFGIDFTISDTETPVANLVVTATSSNTTVVPTANLNLTGSGASRNLKITPTAVGYSDINISVNDGTTSTTFTVNLASSAASTNISTTRFHTGTSDASTAQMIDNNLMIVGDDENQALRVYNRQNSGLPIKSFDFTTSLGLTDVSAGVLREVDIEASAKSGNRIFWLGSHSNASNGNARPNRYRFFATDISGTGTGTTLAYVGRYDGLKTDLLAWDANNGHGLGANYLGLNASAATGVTPETANGSGFNIEGFEIAPNNTTAYICFRAPLATTTTRTKALIIPLTNFADLVSGNPTSTTATFGNPILLDLGGRAIREIKKNTSGEYLIIAGPHDGSTGIAPKDFRFYTWTGNATDAPILKAANLTALNVDGSFESIVDVPSPILSTSSIQVLVDNGDALYYGDATIAKDLPQNNFKKFRSEVVNLGTSALSISTISGTSFCENATVNIAFTSTETYNSGNTFTAQLSDANGSFSNPTVIGTLSGVNAGTILATIPMGTPAGTGYRIRIMASDLAITGEDNGINLSINPIPSAPVAQTNTQIYTGGSISLTATGCSGNYSLNWYKSADDLLVTMPVSPSSTTTYYAKCVPTNNTCTSAKSNEVTVTVLSNTQVITSIVSGNWEESTTWDLGRIPQAGDIVIIDQNHNVILNNIGLAKELKYNSTGKLLLNSASSQLKLGQ